MNEGEETMKVMLRVEFKEKRTMFQECFLMYNFYCFNALFQQRMKRRNTGP